MHAVLSRECSPVTQNALQLIRSERTYRSSIHPGCALVASPTQHVQSQRCKMIRPPSDIRRRCCFLKRSRDLQPRGTFLILSIFRCLARW